MYLQRFYDDGLAQASYLVGCQATGEAIVIDPARHTAPYHEAARAQGLRITAVTETHIHADYLSGTRQLAHEAGAPMYLSGEGGEDWSYQFAGPQDKIVRDGDVIAIGNLTLKVLHTPGHTPEHLSFLLTDHPASDQPIGVFTGDFVFVGDVGRPDLLERAAGMAGTMEAGGRRLFQSLKKFSQLPDHLQIWPAHGAGSACGKGLGSVPSTVLGYEKLANWAFRIADEEEFVREVLAGQPEAPKYFAEMKRANKVGPALLAEGVAPPRGGADELGEHLQKGHLLVDLRGVEAFASGHLPGSLFLPPGKPLVTWGGWLLSYREPFALLLADQAQMDEALRALRSIGLDQVSAVFLPEVLEGRELRVSQRLRADDVSWDQEFVLDVRSALEYEDGHLSGAHHIHLGHLAEHLDEVPDSPVVHCKSGLRSLIASSVLERAGKNPRDVLGGYTAIRQSRAVVAL
jgi:hydroxyacylglutathione hydrolase